MCDLFNPNPYVDVRLVDRIAPCQANRLAYGWLPWLALVVALAGAAGCAHAPAVGRGGPVYAVAVDSVNGRRTANQGSVSYPAVSLQVGDRFARVWLVDASHSDAESPVVLEGDVVALKEGILVERSWSEAIVHQVTDEELAVGFAVVYVPGMPKPTIVELRFEREEVPQARNRRAPRSMGAGQGTASTILPNTSRASSAR